MKKLLVTLLVLLPLLIGLVVALPFIATSDAMRTGLARQISQISGMDIALNGPVNLSVFPDLGLVAKDVALATPEGDLSISVAKIVSGVKLASVFSDQIEIIEVNLHRPEIALLASPQASGTGGTATQADDGQSSDPFAAAVALLERISLQGVSITNGKFTSQAADGTAGVISDINAELEAPSLDGEVGLTFSASMDGRTISATGSLAALRPILQRQPSRLDMSVKMTPAPHPALADLTASGVVLLAEDGSYQVSDGQFTTLGQPLALDAVYRPGKRPYALISLKADRVDLGASENITASTGIETGSKSAPRSQSSSIDLTPLADFDVDLAVQVNAFSMDGVEVSNIDLQAKLKNGELAAKLGNAAIAKGAIALDLSTDIREPSPTMRGSLSGSALAISDLAKLANARSPANGNLGFNIGYAFRGLSAATIRNSFNLAGKVSLSNGSASVPALGELGLGKSAETISNLNLEAAIENVQKPIKLQGQMAWQGETIAFNGNIAPHDFIKNNAGPVALSVKSGKLDVDYSGTASLDGSLKGRAKITTRSLGDLLAWIGQGANSELKDFAYAGNINLDSKKFAFDNAKITLNGINAAGSGSVSLAGRTAINTSLAFDALDIAALTGGEAGSGGGGNAGSGASDVPIDLSALRSIDANIKLKANKLGYSKVSAGPVQTSLVIENGIAKLNVPQTRFYGGSVVADIVADGSSEIPSISIDAKLANIDALPLFSDAAEFQRLEGRFNAELSSQGTGKTTKQFAGSLKGNSSVKFSNGAIKGIDIAKIYNNLTAILTGGFKENQNDKTEFTEMGLSFVINQGVATTDDIRLLGPLVRMDGAGNVNLGKETIDMRLNPQVVASATGQGGEFDVTGIKIPVIIEGALASPRVYPDLSDLLKNPQAALQSLSKLGLNIKGLGDGKLDLKQLALDKLGADKLNLDKLGVDKLNLDKLGSGDTVGEVGKVIGGLIANNNGGAKNGSGSTEQLVGSLLGNLIKPEALETGDETTEQASLGEDQPGSEDIPRATGRIPIPTPNPRKRTAAKPAPKPKTPTEQIVEQVVPKLKLPVDEDATKKTLNDLLNKVLQ